MVEGRRTDGVDVFLGVPFAGAARFAAPVPPEPWTGVRPAVDFGPIAPQGAGAHFQRADLEQAEDCLSLNVWTPAADDGDRPVLVWIHGGAFRQGSGASPLYDGARLASRGDVVVVTINYRLAALGFLSHPDVAVDGGPSGNWGLLDQVEALRWVRDNAAAFGGDPGNVTIFGESAGGASVLLLCTMPSARGLFHKAAAQSGAILGLSPAKAIECAERLADAAGVDRRRGAARDPARGAPGRTGHRRPREHRGDGDVRALPGRSGAPRAIPSPHSAEDRPRACR